MHMAGRDDIDHASPLSGALDNGLIHDITRQYLDVYLRGSWPHAAEMAIQLYTSRGHHQALILFMDPASTTPFGSPPTP